MFSSYCTSPVHDLGSDPDPSSVKQNSSSMKRRDISRRLCDVSVSPEPVRTPTQSGLLSGSGLRLFMFSSWSHTFLGSVSEVVLVCVQSQSGFSGGWQIKASRVGPIRTSSRMDGWTSAAFRL